MYYLVKQTAEARETLLSHVDYRVLIEIANIHYATMDPDNRFYMFICQGEPDPDGFYTVEQYIPVRR